MSRNGVAVHWFRHGLRFHDMPSLTSVLQTCSTIYPVFIFDGETAGTQVVGYNRMRFLSESLKDLDEQLQEHGGRLYIFHGKPEEVFAELFDKWSVTHLSFEQDPEPLWRTRDGKVRQLCSDRKVAIEQKVSHTLWNPNDIIEMNGGSPPLTYALFCLVAEALGEPPRPVDKIELADVQLPIVDYDPATNGVPNPEDEGLSMECEAQQIRVWFGGERRALKHLAERLKVEESAYKEGYYMPNQFEPDLVSPSMSMSAALRFGCLSVRNFYWSLHDLHKSVCPDIPAPTGLTGQLIWREYFYTMSVDNDNYATMKDNPICLNIPWNTDDTQLKRWTEGKTGYPFIDAAMRQLKAEGWIHHVARNAVACFLTRGDLWINWEDGFQVFLKYLIDADWSVCAGNWMWVSSSAFENVLQCSYCVSPIYYGRRLEPSGQYVRRYVPELKDMPLKFLYEPWNASEEVQKEANCVIDKDYPSPIISHEEACAWNTTQMNNIKESLLGQVKVPVHCKPSDDHETRVFLWLPEKCIDNVHPCTH